jgi:hypothetical protein
LSGATWSIRVENLSGSVVYYDWNGSTMMRPASCTKIFTTAAAYGLLGTGYTFQGQSMYTYCANTNKPSDNQKADDLLKEIGRVIGGSSSFSAGKTATFNWLNSIGINTSGAQMFDGSGLNYDNRFSARMTVNLLRYMYNNYSTYRNTFAIGCVDGTLASRFCGTSGSGNAYAKTGTLINGQTISLSGYMRNPNDNKQYLISVYINQVTDIDAARQACDDIFNVMGQAGIPNDGSPDSGIILDAGQSGNEETGAWGASTSSGFYGAQSRWASQVSGATATATSRFTPTIPSTGNYEVFVWWVAGSNRATNAAHRVVHANGTYTLYANQTINGSRWMSLGTHTFNAGTSGYVEVSNEGASTTGKVISTDAVSFVYRGPAAVIVDNTDPGFSASSNWSTSTSNPGYLGANYHVRATASVSDQAKWTVTLPSSGSYKVYARWTADPNRATSAPYSIVHSGGTATVNVNQQQNNGTWVLLGTYNFAAGTAERVRLSCWTSSGQFVVADAVMFEKQ